MLLLLPVTKCHLKISHICPSMIMIYIKVSFSSTSTAGFTASRKVVAENREGGKKEVYKAGGRARERFYVFVIVPVLIQYPVP